MNVEYSSYSARITNSALVLIHHNAYTWTTLGTYSFTPVAGQQYNLKLTVSGSNPVQLGVYLDGVLRIIDPRKNLVGA